MRVNWTKTPLEGSVLAKTFPRLWEFASDNETAVCYRPELREFWIPVVDGPVIDGSASGIVITHDPWSGRALPAPLRNEWFDQIEALGVDTAEPSFRSGLPSEFNSETWWVERGL